MTQVEQRCNENKRKNNNNKKNKKPSFIRL